MASVEFEAHAYKSPAEPEVDLYNVIKLFLTIGGMRNSTACGIFVHCSGTVDVTVAAESE